jgi:hypothetical protein
MSNKLYLFEQLSILFIDNKKGNIIGGSMLNYVLAGAILSDLISKHKIELTIEKKRNTVKITDLSNGFDLHNHILEESFSLIKAHKSKKLNSLIRKIANMKKLKTKTCDSLIKKNILSKHSSSFLFFFTRNKYELLTTRLTIETKNNIINQLQTKEQLSTEISSLVAFINSIGLIEQVFNVKFNKKLKKQINRITKENIVANEVKQVIEGIRVAIITAIIIPIITSSAG